MTRQPLNFSPSSDSSLDTSKHGRFFWSVGLPDGRQVFVTGNRVRVETDGILIVYGYVAENEEGIALMLPSDCWTHVYAAHAFSGEPLNIESIESPEFIFKPDIPSEDQISDR